ncbi:diaminopimelate decarboxylase [Xylanimonas allomyrinae]|uniref:Diaminopimelate decarboxylase n=1 Tax=Xylanimonas allomyrinae TaxID=2509459 RepID=A0A4P6ELY1_9MICO|nr:diaminopimelate decarboxylase [Xylanimonas allomyrinae]QAY63286.1 diaminopimelate decarboxylase [Xylanimonas allomyrinae]
MTAPLGAPWPSSAGRGDDGVLVLGGVSVTALAAEHGTPAYLLDERDFRERARAYRSAFEDAFAQVGTGVDVYYAGKALLTVAVARWAREEGLRVDTASGGELAVALRAGLPGAELGLHGNNKSDAEIAAALDAGVGRIIVDSLVEIDRVADLAAARGVVAPVMVRVTTGVHAGGHEYISTAHEDQKFGLSVNAGPGGGDAPAVEALLRVLARPSLRLLGIHSHIGSQILDAAGFVEAARSVLRLRAHLAARTGVLVDEVDLGGGYGIAYLPGEETLDPRGVAASVAQAVAAVCAQEGTALPRISIEPGRAIVGPAGITLYTVGTVKPVLVTDQDGTTRTRLYVSVDGGMSDNIRPALYDARYHAEIVGRDSDAARVRARVVGKHCESGDIVVHDVDLPEDVRAGDLLAVPATGAYGRSMASNYNLLTRPPVVGVADGGSRVLVRRETVEDLLALDVG